MCRPIRIDDEVRVLFGSDNVIAILKFQTNALISHILSPLNIDTLCTPFADWKPIKQKFELHYRFPMNFMKHQTNQTLNCDYAFVLLFYCFNEIPIFSVTLFGNQLFSFDKSFTRLRWLNVQIVRFAPPLLNRPTAVYSSLWGKKTQNIEINFKSTMRYLMTANHRRSWVLGISYQNNNFPMNFFRFAQVSINKILKSATRNLRNFVK